MANKIYSINEILVSPNQSSRLGNIPQLIVQHIFEGTDTGTKSWVMNPASGVSYHFGISRTGRIRQFVDITRMAWANGTTTVAADSRFVGLATVPLIRQLGGNANWYTVAIGYEGFLNQGNGALTSKQLEAGAWLHRYIRGQVKRLYDHEIPMNRQHIVGHYEINPRTRPNCPGAAFQWDELISMINNSGDKSETAAGSNTNPGVESEIKIGSIVQFSGGNVFRSSTDINPAGSRDASLCEVTAIAPGAARPYHVISIDGGNVHGWVDAETVRKASEEIVVGSMVKITGTAYATGQTIPGWVRSTQHKVSRIADDRALLGANGGINSWVHLRDLKLA